MSHNFILLMLSTDVDAFAQEANQAKDNDYIPSGKTDQIIAHTNLADGGETVEIAFTVPEKKVTILLFVPSQDIMLLEWKGH